MKFDDSGVPGLHVAKEELRSRDKPVPRSLDKRAGRRKGPDASDRSDGGVEEIYLPGRLIQPLACGYLQRVRRSPADLPLGLRADGARRCQVRARRGVILSRQQGQDGVLIAVSRCLPGDGVDVPVP